MYVPVEFAETDLAALDALIERDNFISLVTSRDGLPEVTHLPVLYRREGQRIELRGHFARPNPQAHDSNHALAIVHGPHAYVSPTWYPDKEAQSRVPTWNYAVAHLRGPLVTFDDAPRLAEIVDSLSVRHERAVGSDWRYEPDREAHRRMLRGIVGFTIAVEQIQLKFKLNQNHPAENRLAVAGFLDALDTGHGPDLARLMRERTPA